MLEGVLAATNAPHVAALTAAWTAWHGESAPPAMVAAAVGDVPPGDWDRAVDALAAGFAAYRTNTPVPDATERAIMAARSTQAAGAHLADGAALIPGATRLIAERCSLGERIAVATRLRRAVAEPIVRAVDLVGCVRFVVAADDPAPRGSAPESTPTRNWNASHPVLRGVRRLRTAVGAAAVIEVVVAHPDDASAAAAAGARALLVGEVTFPAPPSRPTADV